MYVGFHKPLHWDFIFMFEPKLSSSSLLMRGEGHGQGNVQRLEHGREKSKERRQCPRKTTACLSFGDKLLLRVGFHENGSQAWLLGECVGLGKATQPGGRARFWDNLILSKLLVHEQSLVQFPTPQDT